MKAQNLLKTKQGELGSDLESLTCKTRIVALLPFGILNWNIDNLVQDGSEFHVENEHQNGV